MMQQQPHSEVLLFLCPGILGLRLYNTIMQEQLSTLFKLGRRSTIAQGTCYIRQSKCQQDVLLAAVGHSLQYLSCNATTTHSQTRSSPQIHAPAEAAHDEKDMQKKQASVSTPQAQYCAPISCGMREQICSISTQRRPACTCSTEHWCFAHGTAYLRTGFPPPGRHRTLGVQY